MNPTFQAVIITTGMTFITLQKSSRVFWRGGVSVFFLCSGLMSLPVQASTNEVDLMRLAATNGLPAFLHFQLALKTGVPDGNQIKTSEFQSNSEFTEIINQKKKASIGVPFQTYSLSLKDVQSFKSGNDLGLLLKPNKNQSIFPVTTGKDVLGGITVEKSDSGWKPTEYTTGGFVSELSVTRDQMIFLSAGREGLKARPLPVEDFTLREAQRKVGELSMELDILKALLEKQGHPQSPRRSA